MAELAIVFGVCLASEGIAALLPISFPASVISMLLLFALLMSGLIKQRHIDRVCRFFVGNMAFFFIAPCVGLIEHVETLLSSLLPFLIICILTTPLVYFVTAWVIQLMMAARRRKRADCD
ncbi:MAG: CidA/LrgA family protein [Lawsonibacter sp.]